MQILSFDGFTWNTFSDGGLADVTIFYLDTHKMFYAGEKSGM